MILGQLAIHMEENKIRIPPHVIKAKKKNKKRKNPDGLHTKCKQIKIKILKAKQRITKRDWQGKRNRSYFFRNQTYLSI